jgi:hypothetical protein
LAVCNSRGSLPYVQKSRIVFVTKSHIAIWKYVRYYESTSNQLLSLVSTNLPASFGVIPVVRDLGGGRFLEVLSLQVSSERHRIILPSTRVAIAIERASGPVMYPCFAQITLDPVSFGIFAFVVFLEETEGLPAHSAQAVVAM